MLRLNKRGVSIMIGYVLLIAIAISLATAVFFYLKAYLPDDNPECNVDVKLILDGAGCYLGGSGDIKVQVNLTNKGLFSVNGTFIKIGDAGRVFKNDLNDGQREFTAYSCTGLVFSGGPSLKPAENYCREYTYDQGTNGPKELSIEPFVYVDGKIALCENAVITKEITCP